MLNLFQYLRESMDLIHRDSELNLSAAGGDERQKMKDGKKEKKLLEFEAVFLISPNT